MFNFFSWKKIEINCKISEVFGRNQQIDFFPPLSTMALISLCVSQLNKQVNEKRCTVPWHEGCHCCWSQAVWRLQRSSALRRLTGRLCFCWRRTTSWEPWTSNWAQLWKSLLRLACSKTRSSSLLLTGHSRPAQDLQISIMTSKTVSVFPRLTSYTFTLLQGLKVFSAGNRCRFQEST